MSNNSDKDYSPPPKRKPDDFDDDDINSYESTSDIWRSGKFTPEDRQQEYRRRGKSPSGVIDGEYNDDYLEDDEIYNDANRDWEADA
jgi:hypothetical protein